MDRDDPKVNIHPGVRGMSTRSGAAPDPNGPVLRYLKDARYECEGASAELREGEERILLMHGSPLMNNVLKVTLTEREARCIAAVLDSAIRWMRVRAEDRP